MAARQGAASALLSYSVDLSALAALSIMSTEGGETGGSADRTRDDARELVVSLKTANALASHCSRKSWCSDAVIQYIRQRPLGVAM